MMNDNTMTMTDLAQRVLGNRSEWMLENDKV
jgi:hypothetical protein